MSHTIRIDHSITIDDQQLPVYNGRQVIAEVDDVRLFSVPVPDETEGMYFAYALDVEITTFLYFLATRDMVLHDLANDQTLHLKAGEPLLWAVRPESNEAPLSGIFTAIEDFEVSNTSGEAGILHIVSGTDNDLTPP